MVASTIVCNSSCSRVFHVSAILIASVITTLLCTQIRFCCRVHLRVTPALKIRSKRVVQRRKCHYTHPSTQALHCQVHPSGVVNVCFACWSWLWFCCCPSRFDNGYNQATWTWHSLRSQPCHNSAHHQIKVIHLTRKTHSSLQSIWMWLLSTILQCYGKPSGGGFGFWGCWLVLSRFMM